MPQYDKEIDDAWKELIKDPKTGKLREPTDEELEARKAKDKKSPPSKLSKVLKHVDKELGIKEPQSSSMQGHNKATKLTEAKIKAAQAAARKK